MKKTDWLDRVRPTAIAFGCMLTGIAVCVIVIPDDLLPAAAWGIVGFAVKGIADALKDLIAKNGGE